MMKTLVIAGLCLLSTATMAQSAQDFAGAERCLTCHNQVAEHDSVHLAALNDSNRQGLPMGSAGTFRCEACHGPSATHAQRQHGADWIMPPVSFSANSNASNGACLDCHGEKLPDLGAHARAFHATAKRNELGCMRCHGGVAHGLPDWVSELSSAQQEAIDP